MKPITYISHMDGGHEPFVDQTTIATLLGFTTRWVRRHEAESNLPFHIIGGRHRYRVSEVLAWVADQTSRGKAA